jgi:AraC family L-rhamnose operon transcriptional activator RhaR
LTHSDLHGLSERARRITREKSFGAHTQEEVFVSPTALAYADVQELRQRRLPNQNVAPYIVDFLEVAVITEGDGYLLSALGPHRLEAGTLVVWRPGTWTERIDCDLEFATLGLSSEALATDLAFLRSRPVMRDLLYSSGRSLGGVRTMPIDPEAVRAYRDQILQIKNFLHERADDRIFILGHVIVALGILASALRGSEEDIPHHPAVESILTRLESEPERPWRVGELAKAVNLDVAYLTRLFRTEVGVPPMAYLARVRVERAASLLAEEAMSVAEVGAAVGWPDAVHFSRRFRALMGVSPSRYRDDMRRFQGG